MISTQVPAQIEPILTQRLAGGDLKEAFQPQSITMAARKIAAYSGDVRKALCICARATEVCAERVDNARREDAKDVPYVVTIADVNAAHRLLTDSAYLGAVEHAAPLEQLVLIALCAELRARKSETAPLEDVARCVEIKQCVGCTRQFFTKSFLGDDAAVLARSSGEEPASPRHRAGVASMSWRTTR